MDWYGATNFLMTQGRFYVKLAESREELDRALALRFEVFNLELGIGLPLAYIDRRDVDEYDKYCDHLIAVDTDCDRVVGTYRLLPGFVAEFNKGYYSENEFCIDNIKKLPGEKLELGRSCVHQEYRSSQVINLLWAGIAKYIEMYDIRYLFGCASLHTSDPAAINPIYSYLSMFHRSDAGHAVYPLKSVRGLQLVPIGDRRAMLKALPPLIKGYMCTGAALCGEPAVDADFGTTDFFVMLETDKLLGRYKKKFFREPERELCSA